MIFNRRVRWNFNRERRENREQKRERPRRVFPSLKRGDREPRWKNWPSVKERVRSNFNRERRENREQKRSVRFSSNSETRESREKFYSLYFLVRTLRVVRGS